MRRAFPVPVPSRPPAAGCAGFTLVEVMIVVAILAPILFIILSVSGYAGGEVTANRRSAEVAERARLAYLRVSNELRSASLLNLEVDAAGSWEPPLDVQPYSAIRYRHVTGFSTGNITNLGPVREIRFVMDPTETPNGQDDDGDGLVDQGRIELVSATGVRGIIATGVEEFSIVKDERRLTITVQCGGMDRFRTVHRTRVEQSIWLRNN